MFRALSSAVLASAALLAAAGVHAQAPAGYYVATPVSAPAKAKLMTRSTPWALRNGAYVATQAPEREMVLCQLVAKDVGGLSAFSAGGKDYDAAALDKCNAKAGVAKTTMAKADTSAASSN